MNNDPVKKPKQKKQKIAKSLSDFSSNDLVYTVPECVSHFMAALANPFESPSGACLPAESFPLPSRKTKVFVRARMQLGTQGIGFAALTPTAASDASFLQTTTSSSVGSANTALGTFTVLQNIVCTQNQFLTADFVPNGVSQRIVAGGLRLKYVGPLTSRSGTTVVFEEPDHADARLLSFNTLSSHPQSERFRIGDAMWDASVCLSGPTHPDELQFQEVQYPLGAGEAPLVIAVSGVAGDVFDVEGFVHYEVIGSRVPDKSKSHSEPTFFGKAIEAAKSLTSDGALYPAKTKSLWDRFVTGVKETLPKIVGAASQMLLKGPGPMKALGLIGTLGSAFMPAMLEDSHRNSTSRRSAPLLLN